MLDPLGLTLAVVVGVLESMLGVVGGVARADGASGWEGARSELAWGWEGSWKAVVVLVVGSSGTGVGEGKTGSIWVGCWSCWAWG